MNTIKACIFDLDGVIVDTAKYHYKSWKKLARTLGFDFPKEDNERLKGVSRMESLEILLKIGKITKSSKEKKALADKKMIGIVSIYLKWMNQKFFQELKSL